MAVRAHLTSREQRCACAGTRMLNAPLVAGGLQRVATVAGLVKWLEKLPPDAIKYHASNHHFSKWLRARSELQAADAIREACARANADGRSVYSRKRRRTHAHTRTHARARAHTHTHTGTACCSLGIAARRSSAIPAGWRAI